MGSEGCFGIALEITVRLSRNPEAVRTLLGDFMSGEGKKESTVVFGGGESGMGTLADKLKKALDSKQDSGQKKTKS